MANTFKSVQKTVNGTAENAYTVPAATTAVIIGMRFGNNGATDVTLTARLNKGGTKTNVLGEATPVPAGSALEGTAGAKLVMETGNILEVEGDGAACAELTLSIMEIT